MLFNVGDRVRIKEGDGKGEIVRVVEARCTTEGFAIYKCDDGYLYSEKILELVEEPKFKVGDRVNIREYLEVGNYYGGIMFNCYMNLLRGKEYTVSSIDNDGIISLHGGKGWLFSPKMLEKVEEKPKIQTTNPVSHPSHYTDGKIEVIDFIEDKKLNFHRGNAVKYISRAGKKDKAKEVEDLEKAVWYLQREIKNLGGRVETDKKDKATAEYILNKVSSGLEKFRIENEEEIKDKYYVETSALVGEITTGLLVEIGKEFGIKPEWEK